MALISNVSTPCRVPVVSLCWSARCSPGARCHLAWQNGATYRGRRHIEAIESGDFTAVTAATEAHIARVFDAIARRLRPDGGSLPDPFLLDTD